MTCLLIDNEYETKKKEYACLKFYFSLWLFNRLGELSEIKNYLIEFFSLLSGFRN